MSYKITAKSVSEYNEIENELNKLPSSVLAYINKAEKIISYIHCSINNSFNNKIEVNLPKDISGVSISSTEFIAFNNKFRFSGSKKENQVININLK